MIAKHFFASFFTTANGLATRRHRLIFPKLVWAGFALLTLSANAGNPLWNGAGSVTNNNFSNLNNWVAGDAPTGNSINNLPVGFGPLAGGATNTANCDATGNPQTWTFNAGTAPMVVTLNTLQVGAATGPDVFLNNSANVQTINGAFTLFDIGGTTTTRRFNAAAGPLVIAPGTMTLRGDSSPTIWAIELAGTVSNNILNCGFANGGNLTGKTVNLLASGTGAWEIMSPLPNLTATASSVTVNGGTLTLDAANSYTGPTVVATRATLNTVTTATGAGTYAVSNNATLGVTRASAGSSLATASLTLGATASDATTLNLNVGSFGNPTVPVINVSGALTVNGTCTLNLAGGAITAGQFSLVKYSSQSGASGFVLGTLPGGVSVVLSNNVANSSVDLVVYPGSIAWNGNVSAVWDINATVNWQSNGVSGLTYTDGEPVTFDDTASGNMAITLNSLVQPLSVTVNSANTYSLSGAGGIGGASPLNKSGGGVFTLNNANTFSGPATVSAGAMVLNNLNAIAAGNVIAIANGAVVQPKLAGIYSSVATVINGSGTAGGSFGGSLDFHSGGSTTVTWPGPITLNAANATIGSYGVSYNVTLAGQLTGSGGLTIRPEGGSAASHTATFTLSNPNNNYAGNTTMQVGTAEASATLKAGVNNALPATTALNLDRAGNSGVVYFDLAGHSQTLAALTADFGSNAVINTGATATLTISNNADNNFIGVIGISGKAGIALVKQGTGTLTLNGTNVYTGATTISAGTLALNGLVTASSGLGLSNNATLQIALCAPGGPTNIIVNGNVTLAGAIGLSDAGIVANTAYPVIYYSGTLNTNGVSVAALTAWNFTIDTSVPHLVRFIPTQRYPLAQFTNVDFAVTSLTTNLGGILRGAPAGPLWYEVRDQTNKLWDFGARSAISPWSIAVRHLRAGTNTVTIFAQDSGGIIQSNSVQLTLTLGPATPVRPRPIPSEIWWGGLSDNTQMTNYSQWPFVQKYEDGYFFHSAGWNPTTTAGLQQSLAQNLVSFNTKFWPELGGGISIITTNSGHAQASTWGSWAAQCEANGIIWSEFTHDYHMENMQTVCQVNPTWPTNDQIAFWTGDLSVADGTYPYGTGIWRDAFNDYYAQFPHVKVGHTSQPEYWPWDGYPAEVVNQLAFAVTNPVTSFSFDAHDIFASFMNMAAAIGHPYFAMQSDAPWNYFGGLGVGSAAQEATMRQKIRVYEQYFQSRGGRHTLICNVSNAGAGNQGSTNAANLYYEASSLSSMYLHQQEGGRANRYLYESWYQGIPYAVVPETQAGTYTHLALTAIKYLKGIEDVNGDLEPLNLNSTATNGTVVQLQLQNNGDVQCLPALAGQAGTVSGVTTRYFANSGAEISATVLTAEGICYTNMLQPGGATNLFAVTLASGLVTPTNDNAYLEAFWNPQDPLGIVRSRAFFETVLSPAVHWSEADIGSAGVAGGSALNGMNFTLLGSGADIGGATDSFHFLWQTNNGDGVITARVTSQTAADSWSKAGVMVRESAAANARNVFIGLTPNYGVTFQNRASTGGVTYSNVVGSLTVPYWVRLTRNGTTFTAQYSVNGTGWTTLGSSNLTGFASSAVWGLAVTAHNNTLASAATFDNVTPPDVAPVLNAIANQTIIAGQTLVITNVATDPNVPPQTLTFSLLTSPTGSSIGSGNGVFTWRPTIAQSPLVTMIQVMVADTGSPSLSATQSFWVTVNQPTSPVLSAPSMNNQIFSLLVNGDLGPDYQLQAASNLAPPVFWRPVSTNLSATPPFLFTDPAAANFNQQFYRVLLGP
jgi:autotransporter-associated beta strand protein